MILSCYPIGQRLTEQHHQRKRQADVTETCQGKLEHDPEKWVRFSEKIMLKQKDRAG
jgi:hypothetical protein